jgi:uncharacterized protein GlcG (DUF336 family)
MVIDRPTPHVQRRRVEVQRQEVTPVKRVAQRPAPRRRPIAARPVPAPASVGQLGQQQPTADTQESRTGTVGVYSNSTSIATKTNTPLVDIPQSVDVLTKSFIQDQAVQNLTELTRYVPGVAIHQGEGNRDVPSGALWCQSDGATIISLRGDGAGIHTLDSAHDKAYTSVSFKTDTTALAERAKGESSIAPLSKLPHVMFFGGGIVIKLGDETIGAIGAAGAPGAKLDDNCAQAGLAKIRDRLK